MDLLTSGGTEPAGAPSDSGDDARIRGRPCGRALIRVFPARHSAAKSARYVAESVSLCWGLSRDRAAEAALVTSELFTGAAAQVPGTEIEVTLHRVAEGLVIEVRDEAGRRPDWTGGPLGRTIVEELSLRWGHHRHDDGDKTVYAVVPSR